LLLVESLEPEHNYFISYKIILCVGSVAQEDNAATLRQENATLRQKLAAAHHTITSQQRHITWLQQKLQRQCSALAPDKFCAQSVHDSSIPGLFKFYTGFTYFTFMSIFSLLVPDSLTSPPFTFPHKLSSLKRVSLRDQLFIVLTRLRCAFTLKDLAFRSGISQQDIGVMCTSWINYMFFVLCFCERSRGSIQLYNF
jgi:hypothetical protein